MAAGGDARFAALEGRVDDLARRLETIEELIAGARRPEPGAEPAPEPEPAAPSAEPPAPPPRRTAALPAVELEDLLGGRVLAWVGGAAVVAGVTFFLATAVRRGWIDEPTRVVLAALGATALLGMGLYLYERQGRTQAALAAVAAALAALYATLTAATQLYGLVAPTLGLALAALVGAVGTAIAVRWGSRLVAGIGIVGALLAPPLVDAGASGASLAFVGIALTAAVGVLLWRRWNWLAAAAFLASAPQLIAWISEEYEQRLGVVLAVLLLFWALYVAAAVGYELRVPAEKLRGSSATLLFVNALLVAGIGYGALTDLEHDAAATAWVVGVAIAHVALGVAAFRTRASHEIGVFVVAVGIGLSAVALALALDGPALVAGWAAEAALLAWVARRTGDRRGHVAAGAFLVLAAGHVLSSEAPPESLLEGVSDLPTATVAIVAVAVALLVAARFYEGAPAKWRLVLAGAGAAAFVYLPSVALVDVLGDDADIREQTPQVALSAFWALVGLAFIVGGLARNNRWLRLGGLALLGAAVAKLVAYDLSELDTGYRALSFVAVGLLLLAGAFAYQRLRREGVR